MIYNAFSKMLFFISFDQNLLIITTVGLIKRYNFLPSWPEA